MHVEIGAMIQRFYRHIAGWDVDEFMNFLDFWVGNFQ